MSRHLANWSLWLVSITTIILCSGCNESSRQSDVFNGVDLQSVLVGAPRVGQIPELRKTESLRHEYALKSLEVVISVPRSQQSNVLERIFHDFTNTIVQLGGKLETNNVNVDIDVKWGSYCITYNTENTVGRLQLYGSQVDNSGLRLTSFLLECPKKW